MTALTIEYWIRMTDPHQSADSTFTYSVYNVAGRGSTGGLAYEAANEMGIFHNPTNDDLWRGQSREIVSSPDNLCYNATKCLEWSHVAVTWCADPTSSAHGQIAFFLDGRLISNATSCAVGTCDMGRPLEPGGIVHFGQDADSPWSNFDELQALTGVVDELRVWPAVRSDAEIITSYRRGFNDVDAATMALYWRFDDVDSTLAHDSSGHLLHGLVGQMDTPRNELTFSTDRPSQRPAAPTQLPSTAPFVGTGPVVSVIVHGANTLVLPSTDADGDALTTTLGLAPTAGMLTPIGGEAAINRGGVITDTARSDSHRVVYTPSAFATWEGDNFTYIVSDGSSSTEATVTLL
jgi:hypothetical protein